MSKSHTIRKTGMTQSFPEMATQTRAKQCYINRRTTWKEKKIRHLLTMERKIMSHREENPNCFYFLITFYLFYILVTASPPSTHTLLPHPTYPYLFPHPSHSFSVSVQERPGVLAISTNQGISSSSQINHVLWLDKVTLCGCQKLVNESETYLVPTVGSPMQDQAIQL